MHMCTVATTPLLMHMRIDAMKVAAAVLMVSNCRQTVSLLANYTSLKGVQWKPWKPLWIRH